MDSQAVAGTANAFAASIQNVRVHHCRAYIVVLQQLLHRSDIIPISSKWVAKE